MLLTRVFAAFALLAAAVQANVIGLDFGSDAMKVALVQPGSPLEIVTNFQSKRKTPTSISFYKNERLFGSDSVAMMARKPDATFSKVYRALGRVSDHPHVEELVKEHYFPHNIYTNDTSGFTHIVTEDTTYSPEELIAMMMQHAKDMTLNFGGKAIKDCVITVPSYFTQHERRALYTAAEIADLNILTLIEENTAAALHYGIDRTFEEPNTVVYYNMGASSVQVTVVTYSSFVVKEGGKNKTIGQFEVVGKAWDSSVGGFNFDVKLAELLATRFNEVWGKKASGKGKDVRAFTRPMTRLRNEANKIKEVLSANQEYPVKAEQLHADVDLVTKVTRADFEEACADLFARITVPIDKALAMANLSLSQVKSVELLGGAVRTPKVKKILEAYFKPAAIELGQHLNGDEAMALGAAFRAANLSTAFRVRKVGMIESSTFGVSIHLETLPVEPEAEPAPGLFDSFLKPSKAKEAEATTTAEEAAATAVWEKNAEVYAVGSSIPSKSKTVIVPYDKDILCRIQYSDPSVLPSGTFPVLAVYNVSGVAAFVKNLSKTHPEAGPTKVHLSFVLGDDGVVSLAKAEVSAELPVVTVDEPAAAGGAAESTNATAAAGDGDNATSTSSDEDDDDAAAANATAADGDASKKDSKKTTTAGKGKGKKATAAQKKENILRSALTVSEQLGAVQPSVWSTADIAYARGRLAALTAADEARKAKEAALNDLEAYIYKVRNKISDDEAALAKVSTEEQRQAVVELSNSAEEWLYDDGRNADVAMYKAKQAEIRKLADKIFSRFSELTARPRAVALAQSSLADVKAKVAVWKEPGSHITEKEVEQIVAAVKRVEDWLEEKQEKQLALSAFEDPVFESSDVSVQMKPVVTLLEKLSKKPKPEKVKVVNATSADNSTDGTVKVNVTVDDVNATDSNNSSGSSSSTGSSSSGSTTEPVDEL